MLEKAIVIFSVNDYPAAELLAERNDCPIYPSKHAIPSDIHIKQLFIVGGDKKNVKADDIVLLAGDGRLDTYKAVQEYLK